jgi:myb proto-oncogene protein
MSTIWRPNVRIPIPESPPDVPRAVDAGDEGEDAAADDLVFLGSGNVNDATGVHEPKKVKTRDIDEIYEDGAVPTWPKKMKMKKARMKKIHAGPHTCACDPMPQKHEPQDGSRTLFPMLPRTEAEARNALWTCAPVKRRPDIARVVKRKVIDDAGAKDAKDDETPREPPPVRRRELMKAINYVSKDPPVEPQRDGLEAAVSGLGLEHEVAALYARQPGKVKTGVEVDWASVHAEMRAEVAGYVNKDPGPVPVHVDQKPGKVKEDTSPTDVIVISDDEDDDTEETEDGGGLLRKSPRERTKPLRLWRGETRKREGKEGTTAEVEKGFKVGTVKNLRELLTPNTALNAPKGYAWVTEADHDLIVKEWEERERVKKIPARVNTPQTNFTTPNNHWKPWTPDEDLKLMHALWLHRRERELSATEFWQMMAKTLDRGWQAVQWRCNAFQLRGDWSPLEAKAGDQDQPREAQHRASPSPSLGRKTDWTKEEDAQLVRLVETHGHQGNGTKWSKIASLLLYTRTGKQCRERWHNHLRPDIKRGPWTETEERLLIAAHELFGNRWADIAANIPGRTENAVKNHWYVTSRRRDVPVRRNGSSWCYASTSCGKVDPGSVASTAASRTRRSGAWDPRDPRLCATPAA